MCQALSPIYVKRCLFAPPNINVIAVQALHGHERNITHQFEQFLNYCTCRHVGDRTMYELCVPKGAFICLALPTNGHQICYSNVWRVWAAWTIGTFLIESFRMVMHAKVREYALRVCIMQNGKVV